MVSYKLKAPCRSIGCPNTVRGGGYCEVHKDEEHKKDYDNRKLRYERDNDSKDRQRFYHSRKWQAIRLKVLQEHPVCQVINCLNPASEVDHITAIQDGGSMTDRANLQALCVSCHAKKTAREVSDRKRLLKRIG